VVPVPPLDRALEATARSGVLTLPEMRLQGTLSLGQPDLTSTEGIWIKRLQQKSGERGLGSGVILKTELPGWADGRLVG
jgi:hypothetical protein